MGGFDAGQTAVRKIHRANVCCNHEQHGEQGCRCPGSVSSFHAPPTCPALIFDQPPRLDFPSPGGEALVVHRRVYADDVLPTLGSVGNLSRKKEADPLDWLAPRLDLFELATKTRRFLA